MKILLASHTSMEGSIVVGSHQLARSFARSGHEVLHLATPLTPGYLKDLKVTSLRRHRTKPLATSADGGSGVVELIPFSVVPLRLQARFGPVQNVALATMLPPLRRLLGSAGFHAVDLLLIDEPFYSGIWNHLECETVVYRPTDVYPLFLRNRRIAALERAILAAAHGVISTSCVVDEHVSSLLERSIPRMVLENGVEYDHISAPAARPSEYERIPEPRVVYVGSLDDRFDWQALFDGARYLRDVQFVLIGPFRAIPSGASEFGNLHILGPRDYQVIPGYLQHADMGLLPLNDHPANQGRSPMKLFEYMAAGLGVVARATVELKRRGLPLVSLYRESKDFGGALESSLASGTDRQSARTIAREYSWHNRSERILDFVAKVRGVMHSLLQGVAV